MFYPNHIYLSEVRLTSPSDLQRDIPRRAILDKKWPKEKWGKERIVKDPEDFYPEAHLPKAPIVRRGKASLSSYCRNPRDMDTSDDECQELITLDAVPLNAFHPDPDAPPASGKRKARTEAPPTEAPPTDAPSASNQGGARRRYKRSAHKTARKSPPAKKQKRTAGRTKPMRQIYDG